MGVLSGILGTSNNFHADQAKLDHSDFSGAMGQGLHGQADARGQQSALVNMLMQQANGGGPNPAALQLQQGTEANARMAASQMASQRGLNPALAARGVMDATANMNQQAAGQAGIMRAQQQLAAQGQLGGVLGQQRGQDLSLYGGAAGAQNAQNNTNVANTQGANQINAGVAAGNAQTNGQIAGGILGGVGSAIGLASGGPVPGLQDGFASLIGGAGERGINALGNAVATLQGGGKVPGKANVPGDSPKNDTVPAALSPGEVVLPRSIADDPEGAAAFVRAIRRRKEAAQSGAGYGRVLQAGAKAYSRGGTVC